MEFYTALIYIFVSVLLIIVFLIIWRKNNQSSKKTISEFAKLGAKKVIWRKKHDLTSSSDEIEVIFGKNSYGEELEKDLGLKNAIKKRNKEIIKEVQYVNQYVNDNYLGHSLLKR